MSQTAVASGQNGGQLHGRTGQLGPLKEKKLFLNSDYLIRVLKVTKGKHYK